jgi:hypothetical protein
MKKILNVDIEKPVKIVPYAFNDDKGKVKKGITIYQGEQKIENYFYDATKKKNLHGYPEPKKLKKPLSKDQWKMYFMEARMFLEEKISEHFKLDNEKELTPKEKLDKEFDGKK